MLIKISNSVKVHQNGNTLFIESPLSPAFYPNNFFAFSIVMPKTNSTIVEACLLVVGPEFMGFGDPLGLNKAGTFT